jgi:hypothetical protein
LPAREKAIHVGMKQEDYRIAERDVWVIQCSADMTMRKIVDALKTGSQILDSSPHW